MKAQLQASAYNVAYAIQKTGRRGQDTKQLIRQWCAIQRQLLRL